MQDLDDFAKDKYKFKISPTRIVNFKTDDTSD